MIQKEVTAKVPAKTDKETGVTTPELGPVSIVVAFPETLKEASDWCSEEALLSNAFANFRVNPIQSGIRACLKSGMTAEQIQEKLGTAVMGVAQTGGRVDAQTAFIAKFKMATPEGQAEMLQLLRDAAQPGEE